MLYSHLHHHSASQRHNIKDRRRNEGRMIKTHEGRHVKENAGSFFTTYLPLTLLQGFERLACERMPETEHKIYILTPLLWLSRCVLFSWCWGPLHRGFSEDRLGRVWPSLPILVSTVWKSAGNCIGGFRGPLGRVWPFLPHLVSNSLGVCWQLLWDPNSTELNNNSTPTQSPTGSLNRMFNRHQAEITVMQFRGYSLPVHDCNGRMEPSPFPIS